MPVSIVNRKLKTVNPAALRVAGLMSGTSADGIDVAIVNFARRKVSLQAYGVFPYPDDVRKSVLSASAADAADLCHLNFGLGHLFADALIALCKRKHIALSSIDLIGSHGQTVWHQPTGRRFGRTLIRSTLQLGEPSVIAARTGITTVADFRPADIAAGGQGAPLVAFADYFLFSHRRKTRVVQNIGGIANLTWLKAGGCLDDIIAFDTGPGNMMIDRLAWHATGGRQNYDRDGRLAAKGTVNPAALRWLGRHLFFCKQPPRTTGREDFGHRLTDRFRGKWHMPAEDLVATATALTATSIARAYRRYLPGYPDEVILCGGGARNPVLVAMLRKELAPAKVMLTDDFGIDADAKEAVSFAILARETLFGRPSNVPSATGARRPAILGTIVYGNPA
jgi:anhydro-N-acetylmuramic acid kinase